MYYLIFQFDKQNTFRKEIEIKIIVNIVYSVSYSVLNFVLVKSTNEIMADLIPMGLYNI